LNFSIKFIISAVLGFAQNLKRKIIPLHIQPKKNMVTAHIQTPTPKLSTSQSFYIRLGFKPITENQTVFSDGKAIIEINADRFARAGIKLFQSSWQKEKEELEKTSKCISLPNGYMLTDPNGVWIYLLEGNSGLNPDAEQSSFGVLGNYAGMALEAIDMEKSADFYQKLGFQTAGGAPESGYVTYQREGFAISLLKALNCPHLFFNPSLTYFNGKQNPAIIQNIRELNIPITEEITVFNKEGLVDNVIIRDPGGLGFFVFND
jgi:predicted lactoylglutathione lyase